jgi:nucleoside-diphosphate-sugar epimerase
MRVVVTGASGFIGGALCPALRDRNHEALSLDPRQGLHELKEPMADAIVHLAGIAHRKADIAALREANVTTTDMVGRLAAEIGIPLIFVSTVKVHGEESTVPFTEASPIAPGDAYAAVKAEAEERLLAQPRLKLTILRPPLVYGPGVKANFRALLKAVANRWPLPFAAIRNRRSIIYVGNLVDAIMLCIESPPVSSRTFLVSDGAPVSTPELCRAMGTALGVETRLFRLNSAFLEMLPGMKKLTRSLVVDDSAIRGQLGWRPPFTLQQGLIRTAEWHVSRARASAAGIP